VANLKQVREALTSVISTKCGIDTRPYFPDTVTPPMVSFTPGSPPISFGSTMNEQLEVMGAPLAPPSPNDYKLNAIVIVSRAVTETAQALLDELIDSGTNRDDGLLSVPDALVLDSTLGGVVDWCLPMEVTAYGQVDIGGTPYFHAVISLSISS
jgi:hypothetical protein